MDAVSDAAVKEVWVMKSAQVGWALDIETPIPTPDGWALIGDLRAGDTVFDERGKPCRITFATPVMTDHACFAVQFSDGERIIADADHRWFVQSAHAVPVESRPIRRRRSEGVLTTAQLQEAGVTYTHSGKARHRFAVPAVAPLNLPTSALPIAPYTLGAWLGDGHSYTSQLTLHESDGGVAERIERDGYLIEPVDRTESGVLTVAIRAAGHERGGPGGRCEITRSLRKAGVLQNKHIPRQYLRASIEQRLALLQGLMDTDGTISINGRAEFCSTSKSIAAGVGELLASFGIKFTIARAANHAIVRGQRKRSADRYRLSFLPYADVPVFSLSRKRDRQRSRGGKARESQTDRRRIIAIDPVPSVPVRCIQVDSPNRLYLAGFRMVPTHNTEILNNVIGYHVDQDPAPMLLVQPTLELAEAWSKDRLAPMVRDTPALRDRIADAKARDSGNTLLHKSFTGGRLTIAGANSPAGLASRPIRIVLFDEVDRFPTSAGAEGDPIALGIKRARTFWNRKVLAGSTPTIKGSSRIEVGFEQSDQRYYHVPCPECGAYQRLVWAQVRWPDGQPWAAVYVCAHCAAELTDAQKPDMLAHGEWRSSKPFNGTAGFHVSELYSPWSSWSEMAEGFLKAKRLPETLQTWINTSLGETWEDAGEKLEPAGLLARRESYTANSLPPGVLLLTVGTDVQDDRLESTVWGWGAEEEAWRVEHVVLRGDPGSSALWKEHDDLLRRRYRTDDGRDLVIEACGVDSGGHFTEQVYRYCAARKRFRVWAVKGVGGPGRLAWPKKASRAKVGQVWPVGVDTAKDVLFQRLKRVTEPGPGFIHFDATTDEEWLEQFTSEVIVYRIAQGRRMRSWRPKQAGIRQEALDATVYAWCVLQGRGGAELLRRRGVRSERTVVHEPILSATEQSAAERPPEAVKARPVKRRANNWVNRWR